MIGPSSFGVENFKRPPFHDRKKPQRATKAASVFQKRIGLFFCFVFSPRRDFARRFFA
jgi:hypothetical protein